MDIDIEKYLLDPSDFEVDNKKKKILAGNAVITFQIQKSTNQKCAVKRTKKKLINEKTTRSFEREIKTLAKFQHPAIVPFLGFSKISDYGYIYLIRFNKGSLYSLILKRNERDPNFDLTHKYIIAYGVARAMQCLHQEEWIHRDLKSENILLDDELRPFLTDFGTSKKINKKSKINQTTKFTSYIIMAPEFMDNPILHSNSLSIDVYSFGITLYELLTEIQPFNEYEDRFYQLKKYVTSGGRPNIPDSIPNNWKELIEHCWSGDPSDRPTFNEIVEKLESPDFLNEEFPTDKINQDLFNEYRNYLNDNVKRIQITKPNNQNIEKITDETTKEEKKDVKLHIPSSVILQNMEKEVENELKNGSISSLFNYAVALFKGTYSDPDYDKAYQMCIKYINHPNSQKNVNDVGILLYYTGKILVDRKDFKNAKTKLENSVNKGNADAAFLLANLKVDEITYLIKDRNIRENYLKVAAEKGNIEAIKQYADMLYSGQLSRSIDKKQAIQFIKKGSDDGEPELMYKWSIRKEYGIDIEQDTDEAMKLLVLAMNKYYKPAIVSYAFHLYNGVNIDQNIKSATEFFQVAADIGDPESILWSYVISSNNGHEDEYKQQFLDLIRNNEQIPEAWSIYGRQLFQCNHLEEASIFLHMAMGEGSISSMLTLAEMCQKDSSLGDNNFYYEAAAHHCHLLDEIGFFLPVKIKVFHCNECNIDMCEGCAMFCHKNHSSKITFVDYMSPFKCNCGKNGLNGHCSGEFVGEKLCYQHLYRCSTCCTKSDSQYICKSCAEKCHTGHEIVDCGIRKDFCSCGMKKLRKCKILDFTENPSDFCTKKLIKQRCFQCVNCNIYGNGNVGMCEKCAELCIDDEEEDHIIIDLGVKKFKCNSDK